MLSFIVIRLLGAVAVFIVFGALEVSIEPEEVSIVIEVDTVENDA